MAWWGRYLARGEPLPLVSVVIPTRGTKPELLQRALESVAAQHQRRPAGGGDGAAFALEVVVVVDNPDATIALPPAPTNGRGGGAAGAAGAADVAPIVRFKALRLSPPSGGRPGLARNLAIRAARGAWIAFLDDDDAWAPEKTARQLDVLLAAGRTGTGPRSATNESLLEIEMCCSLALEAPERALPSAAERTCTLMAVLAAAPPLEARVRDH